MSKKRNCSDSQPVTTTGLIDKPDFGALQYRCRMCGKVFNGVGGNFGMMERALVLLTLNDAVSEADKKFFDIGGAFALARYEWHQHKDGTVGFGELIGLVKD